MDHFASPPGGGQNYKWTKGDEEQLLYVDIDKSIMAEWITRLPSI
jgi:hypothetical protein